MDKYINQILEILKSLSTSNSMHDNSITSIDEHLELLDQWLETPPTSFAAEFDITQEFFPPSNLLNKDQMAKIYEAISELLESKGTILSFPSEIPLEFKYTVVVDEWKNFELGPCGGNLIYDFCTGSSEDCVLKQYCPCKRFD